MDQIIIEEKQSSVLRSNLLGVLMTILSGAILIMGIKDRVFIYTVVGAIATLFFFAATIYLFSRVVKPRALLTIQREGVIDSSSASACGLIPFREIESFEVVNVYGQEMIGVNLKDTQHFIAGLSSVRQKAARANLKMKLPPISIRVDTAKDISIEDILTLLQKRLADYSSLYY